MLKQIHKSTIIFVLIAFLAASVKSPAYAQSAEQAMMPHLPVPGVMVHLSPEFTPAHLVGMVIHPDNALQFDFLVHRGDVPLTDTQKRQEYKKLVKYFLASLTIPDEDQWVNLSPYEKDRIIKDDFGKTEMGRDLLSQDYILKQITASLIYPNDKLGQKFWDRVYAKAYQQFGSTNIPVNTFNKVWIIPDQAVVYESGNTAYVLRDHLKVMLEEDYLSLSRHSEGVRSTTEESKGVLRSFTNVQDNKAHSIASQIIREIILPELEREVNEGKNFANLRQVYSGMILATWYKKALKESLLGKIYANKAKVRGVDQNPKSNEEIYQRYLKAFKKGVFNYIKEDVDKYTNETIPRKYFSGGDVGFVDGAMYTPVMKQGRVAIVTPATVKKLSSSSIDFAALTDDAIDRAAISLTTPDEPMGAEQRQRQEAAGKIRIELQQNRIRFSDWLWFIEAYTHSHGLTIGSDLDKKFHKIGRIVFSGVNGNKNLREFRESIFDDISEGWEAPHMKPDAAMAMSSFKNLDSFSGLNIHPLDIDPSGVQFELDTNQVRKIFRACKEIEAEAEIIGDTHMVDLLDGIFKSPGGFVSRFRSAIYLDPNLRGSASPQTGIVAIDVDLFNTAAAGNYLWSSLKEVIIHELNHIIDFGLPNRSNFLKNTNALETSAIIRTAAYFKGQIKENGSQWAAFYKDKRSSRNGPRVAVFGTKDSFLRGTSIDEYDNSAPVHPYAYFDQLAEKHSGISRGDPSQMTPLGGIDFNSANLDLQIRRDGRGVPLPLAQQDMAQLSRIRGFIPEIMGIRPEVDLPVLRELQQKLQAPSSVAAHV